MASAHQIMKVPVVESFWRALKVEIQPFFVISLSSGPRMPKELVEGTPGPKIWLSGISRMLKD